MFFFQTLSLFDISAIVIIMLLSYLSRRLGQALKIPRYYYLMYLSVAAIASALMLESLMITAKVSLPILLPMALRCGASLIALVVCLRYWSWLIGEFFKK